MKGLATVALCVVFVAVVWARPDEESYGDEFKDFDVDEVLHSDRLLTNYLHCIYTGEKCTPEGKRLRELIPDALKTKCGKCTDPQKEQTKKVIRFLIKEKPDDFKKLENQFDQDHHYRRDYADEIKAEGLVLPD